jgi:hypothetical protein
MSDLTLPIIGLTALVGYFFSKDGKNPREVKLSRGKIETFDKPNGGNIYSSNMVAEADQEILDRSLHNYKLAENPSESGVLPPIFNSYSVVGNESVLNSILNTDISGVSSEQLGKINTVNKVVDIINKDKKVNVDNLPMFKSLGGTFIGTEVPTNAQIENSKINFSGDEKDINLLTGLPYDVSHSNMVPFFGSNIKQNVETFNNESILDRHTGNTSTFKHKEEITKFFKEKPENIYGAPVFTNEVEIDRYIPSLYRQSEKPFQEQRIYAEKAGTFENPIMPQFKTVDELRVADKPKETYEGRTLSGQRASVRGIQSEVHKRRPDTYYEQVNPDELFRGPGEFLAPKIPENYSENFKSSSREGYNMEYYGNANQSELNKSKQRLTTVDNSDEFLALFQEPKRQNFENDYSRNLSGSVTSKSVNDYGKSGYKSYETERHTTEDKAHVLNVNDSKTGSKIRQLDPAKGTIKETTLKYDNSGNVKSVFERGTMATYDSGLSSMDAKTTQKQTLVDNKYIGQMQKEDGMGYVVAKYDAKTTGKEIITNNSEYSGNANQHVKNVKVYSTYENPIKVRNAVHTDYKGNVNLNAEASSREKYNNAEIRDDKQNVLMGERPSGPQNFQISSGKVSYGDIKSTGNMILKEEQDDRERLNDQYLQIIPTKSNIGMISKPRYDNDPEDTVDNSRLDPMLVHNQLKENPFVNTFKEPKSN